jgi:hypothetical protein
MLVAGGTATAALWPGQEQPAASSTPDRQPDVSTPPMTTDRSQERPSRSVERSTVERPERVAGTAEAPAITTEAMFLTEDLNVWSGPGEDNELLTVLDEGSKVPATGRVVDGWAEIVFKDQLRWVNAEYLSTDRPDDDAEPSGDSGGLSDAPCPTGSDVEDGLVSNAIAVYRAVCAEFPEVTTYYGLRPGDDGEHGTGQALDIMIPDSATGDAIAAFVQDNYSALGVSEILWSQQIWTVERASEGWRWMEDRGSDTANHYDHVHVTVY